MGDWVPSKAVAVKALSVLGSTGSIGTQTLEIVEEFPERFRVVALTAELMRSYEDRPEEEG